MIKVLTQVNDSTFGSSVVIIHPTVHFNTMNDIEFPSIISNSKQKFGVAITMHDAMFSLLPPELRNKESSFFTSNLSTLSV